MSFSIDARHKIGYPGREVNHSKDPNLIAKIVYDQSSLPHVIYVAKRDIFPGTELTSEIQIVPFQCLK